MKTEKKEITAYLCNIMELDQLIKGNFQDVHNKLVEIENKLKTDYPNLIRFELGIEHSDIYDELIIKCIRLETDNEFQKRIEKSENQKKAQKNQPRKEKKTR